ncbi:MAG TPA: peptidoglycan glycosyltransferase, partial [Phaeodactylibacter sp.]|nr:peptidoglycan glycosyltransferase [Phaeodactylibacter sp.]
MSQTKNEVLYRVYIVLGMVVIFAGFIFYFAVKINVIEGKKWRKEGEKHTKFYTVKASRGNIMTEDGSLLASSLPFFDIYFDTQTPSDEEFNLNVDSLALGLIPFVADELNFTEGGLRDSLVRARASNQRYMHIKKGASFVEYEQMKKLPIFRKGRYKGGFIAEENFRRRRPYGLLARRTIGYVKQNG